MKVKLFQSCLVRSCLSDLAIQLIIFNKLRPLAFLMRVNILKCLLISRSSLFQERVYYAYQAQYTGVKLVETQL
jgi:hypothetical protein